MPSSRAPGTDEIEALFVRFVDAYDRGRSEALTTLFDADAQAHQQQGRAAIQREYDELFRRSQWRRMQLNRVDWRTQGETVYARAEATIRIGWRDGREVEQRLSIDMDLARRDGRIVITRLVQQVAVP